jgi:general secretion pathway protein C
MNKRLSLVLSLLGLILLAASLAYWILQLYQPPQRPLAAVPRSSMPEPSIDAAATLFGGQVATASASNYQLTGIVAAGRKSVAIIVAEGSPPKALSLGKELVPGITLAEVHLRYVMLSDGGVMKRLDLAPDTKPAASMGGAGAPPGAAVSAPSPVSTGTVQEPPMAPGAIQQPAQQGQEPGNPAEAGQHEAPAPANPNSAVGNQNNPNANNPAPAPVQMPPPTRSTGTPVGGAVPTTQ